MVRGARGSGGAERLILRTGDHDLTWLTEE